MLIDRELLNLLNCVFQGIIAFAAVVAIIITIKQISGKTSINLNMKKEFRISEIKEGQFVVELVIHMVNLGMAPVYISSTGVQLWIHNKPKFKMKIANDAFVLQSGHCKSVYGVYHSEMIDDKASLHDKIKIYAECQMNKVFYDRTVFSYDEFFHEYERMRKRIEKVN